MMAVVETLYTTSCAMHGGHVIGVLENRRTISVRARLATHALRNALARL